MNKTFSNRKFLITIGLIIWVSILITIGKVQNPELAIDFIKWIFITYIGGELGEDLITKTKWRKE